MTITRTSLTNPNYLERIKAAVVRAVRKANRPAQPRGIAQEPVYNRRTKPSLMVVARKGGGFEVFDDEDRDVTDIVKAALRDYHAAKGADHGQ